MANFLKRIFGQPRILVFLFVLVLGAGGIFWAARTRSRPTPGGTTIPVQGNPPVERVENGGSSAMAGKPQPVSIRLGAGQAQPQAVQAVPVATGEPLSPAEIEALLGRLPALDSQPGDQADFRPAGDPLPPPRPGETIAQPFPPPAEPIQPPAVAAGPLQVLRFSPEGEVPVAPRVDITFNQPMVPVGTLEDLSAEAAPAQIDPPLPGTWRWLGTQTLSFEYDSAAIDRLPKATTYRVSVPAGVRSATGGVLAETIAWTFTTPPPVMITGYPKDIPQPLAPLFFIAFDQRIDPAAVLASIDVAAGDAPVSLSLASAADVQVEEQVSRLVGDAGEGRWLAFRAQAPLPADTQITVTVRAGTPSAEGPLLTQADQSFSFHTYAPLQIVEHRCSWSSDPCQPLAPFYIRFNNPLDPQAFQEAMLSIQPELPGASVNLYGDTLEIQGATRGRTTYTVTVAGQLQDSFGQQLGADAQLEFRVGPATPTLAGPEGNFLTLDPTAAKPVFPVYAINYKQLDVRVYAVQPADWPAFQSYLRQRDGTNASPQPPGRLVLDQSQAVDAPEDTLSEVGIDLSPLMPTPYGQFVVVVEPPGGLFRSAQDRYWQSVHAWVQVTQIGLDAFTDHSEMVVWAAALKDGAPLAGVTVQPGPSGAPAVTDADGLARFAIPNGAAYLVASLGQDQALLPRSSYFWSEEAWNSGPARDQLRWLVFDDRQMYRPGEQMHLKGWLRRIGGRQDGDVGPVGAAVTAVRYRVVDPQGNDLGSGRAEIGVLGGFDLAFELPAQTNLGYAQIVFEADGGLQDLDGTSYAHSFQIQEFRRPEFEVTARNETAGPYFVGDQAVVAVEARYYAGDPLPNAEVTWQVATTPGHYAPPNWPDFSFGDWQPWWWAGRAFMEWGGPSPEAGTVYETFSGVTDASGNHYLNLDFESLGEPRPLSVTADATVMDVNRQAWTGSTSLLVHPASLYVGLRSERLFIERGQPLKVDLIVTDLDGNPIPGRPVEVQAARLEWKFRDGVWGEEEVDPQACSQVSSLEPVACTFDTPLGGSYRITARVADELGRPNRSTLTRWVSGGQQPPARQVEQEAVTLIPDRESYQPGDVAQVLVQSPFSPAEGLLTVSRSGLLYTQRFRLEAGSTTLQVPIEERHIPNLNLQVDLVGAAVRSDDRGEPLAGAPPRPAYATGQLNLEIPPLQRALTVELAPAAVELEPGGETTLAVTLRDAAGAPAPGAELAVMVVDEAVLALSSYQLADPLAVFYAARPPELESVYSRANILLADPLAMAVQAGRAALQKDAFGAQPVEAPAAMEAAPSPTMQAGAAADRQSAAPEPIRLRTDFNPLAAFAPAVTTDAAGQAVIPVKLPDNLTRYRVMVVAVAGGRQFGSAETNLVARLPLMARPSAPRFLNFGDRFELPVVLQNGTGEPLVVDVAARAANLELIGSAGLRVTVPPHDRVEVRFPAAAQSAGVARFQVAAVAGSYADAAVVELPVYTPATSEAFATYGVLDAGAVLQPVTAPTGVFPQYGGLEIQTSSTALQALTDAVLYLVSYPFECSEQLASRLLSIAALRDVLAAFQAAGLPAPQELEASARADIDRLQGLQNGDGGFPYWRRGQESIPFNTIHVAHALQRAEQMGFPVPADMKARALDYLRQVESYYPEWYSDETRWTLSAYALYVRGRLGDRDPDKALRLYNEAGLEKLPLDAVGWLWQVLQGVPGAEDALQAIHRHVENRAVETAGAANFTTGYTDQAYLLLSSDRRTDAILLEALMSAEPQHDLIPKLVNGLLAHRTRGRWENTQENVFVLLALDHYFKTFEAQTPDFVARLWLGDTYAGSSTFQGRTTERQETRIPMDYLLTAAQGGQQGLVLSKEGAGRLYYRLGLRYAPTDLQLDPLDMGFVVQRIYEGVDDPADVSQDEAGAWHIRAGARVRVKLTMVARDRRYHVALVDHLPAGLEILNPELAVTGGLPPEPGGPQKPFGWWWWTWYEHQNLRDERAEAFTTLLWEGVYEYTYLARATTPGTFVVPPAKAEEMYSPEVFGRSAGSLVIVE